MSQDITYKHIELQSRPHQSCRIEAKVCFFIKNSMYNYSYVGTSEAECLAQLNKHVKEFQQRLETLEN